MQQAQISPVSLPLPKADEEEAKDLEDTPPILVPLPEADEKEVEDLEDVSPAFLPLPKPDEKEIKDLENVSVDLVIPTTFNTLPPEVQVIIVLKALEVSPHQDSITVTKLPLYEKDVTLKLASVSSAFLDHVVVACHSKRFQFVYTFRQMSKSRPRQQQDMDCKHPQRKASDPLASMRTLERALPKTSPLFKWLYCEHCDMLESFEEAIIAWRKEMMLLCRDTIIVEDLVWLLEAVRSRIGTCPPPERLKPWVTERRGLRRLSVPVRPVRN